MGSIAFLQIPGAFEVAKNDTAKPFSSEAYLNNAEAQAEGENAYWDNLWKLNPSEVWKTNPRKAIGYSLHNGLSSAANTALTGLDSVLGVNREAAEHGSRSAVDAKVRQTAEDISNLIFPKPRETAMQLGAVPNPDLDAMIGQFGESGSPVEGPSFITPRGTHIDTGGLTHADAVRVSKGQAPEPSNPDVSIRDKFLNDTGTVRARVHKGSDSTRISFTVPDSGPTEDQVAGMKLHTLRNLRDSGGRGDILIETTGGKSSSQSFVNANKIDSMLDSIGFNQPKGVLDQVPGAVRVKTITSASGRKMQMPPERTTGIYDNLIKQGGGIPAGIFKGIGPDGQDLIMFHSPKTGSTLGLPADEISPEAVAKHISESNAKFKQ